MSRKKTVKLRIVGHGKFEPNAPPPMILKIIKFISKAKYGDLYYARDLARILGYNRTHFKEVTAKSPLVQKYRYKQRGITATLWGSEATIRYLKSKSQ